MGTLKVPRGICKGRSKTGRRCRRRLRAPKSHCPHHKHPPKKPRKLLQADAAVPNDGNASRTSSAEVSNIPSTRLGRAAEDLNSDENMSATSTQDADPVYDNTPSRDAGTINIAKDCGNTVNTNCGNEIHHNYGDTTTYNTTNILQAKPPESPAEYRTYINNFVTNNFPGFPDLDISIDSLVNAAVAKVKSISEEYHLAPERAPGIVKLAVYDFVILCDDSFSMRKHKRKLKGTLIRLAKIASLLTPLGISVRFLNHTGENTNSLDGLLTINEIEQQFSKVWFIGFSRLGTALNEKVVQPLIIRKAEAHTLRRPVITMVITDGQPSGEDSDTFKNCIRTCKHSPALQSYGPGAAVFLVTQIGNSNKANQFLRGLEDDETIKDFVCCSKEALDPQEELCRRRGNDALYMGWLIELFLTALDCRTG
ncbi:transcription factor RfeF [Metarhizium guizhouense ARSEF 977]|uniref:Transcription factor RfeF n=1 Tax=Metarhizium guizhouense (strain ARSEF 977) TaxID=1276136 RepID=A0A0B4GF73_METGA|nr:transcription factor RfeF [Metarhizium guizhouense ARSEF 977]